MITDQSHDFAGVPPGLGRDGRLPVSAAAASCDGGGVEAEALEGGEQVEVAVLALGIRANDLGELGRERHLPSHRPQVARVLVALTGQK